ncbi:3-(3-hydroxy-phenyl)propionate transporter MhpT [Methylobacterium sp. JK268]
MANTMALGREASGSGLLTVGLCTLVTMIEGFDLQSAGVAAPRLAPAFQLAPAQLGLFFSASTAGLFLGAILGGRLSDRIGRKRTLLVSIAVFGLMSVLTGLAGTFPTLLAARALTGFGLGGALPNLIALVAENVPPARRSSAVALLYAGLPAGGALTSVASLLHADPSDWATIFLIGGIVPLVVLPAIALWLPDSRSLAEPAAGPVRSLTWALFAEGRAGATALLWTAFFLGLLVLYLLLNWLPSLLIARGLSRADAAWVQMAFNIGSALGSVATGILMERWGRTPTTLLVFGASAAAILLLLGVPPDLTATLAVGACVGATISGSQTVLYALAATCYPTEGRGTGVGAAVSAGRLGSVAGPLLAGALIGAGQGNGQVLLLLVPILLVSGAAGALLARRLGAA